MNHTIESKKNRIRNKKNMIRKTRRELESDIASKAKTEPKAVWSLIKSKARVVQGVPDLYLNNTKCDKLTTWDSDNAQFLSDFFLFASVHVSENSDDAVPELKHESLNDKMDKLYITKAIIP